MLPKTTKLVSLTLVCASALTIPLKAQIATSPPPAGATTHTMAAGERYRRGALGRFLFGGDYRELWTVPIEAPVLNLDSVGGGLTPFRTGGSGQTTSLHFRGNDGRRYVVRSVDKDPAKRLIPDLRGTFAESVIQDQISSLHPLAALVVDPLLEVAGVLHAEHTLVIVPDDPRLGEFRETFAGMLGMLVLHPDEGADNTAGFAGSRLISGSERFFERLAESPCDRVDAHAFLKARMIDILVGDKDRHAGQWRWASFPDGDCRLWQPIPEDRDQAFVDFDGLVMGVARLMRRQQIGFSPSYPSLFGLTFNGWEVDRELLAEVSKSSWDSIAVAVQREITDDVINDAVRRMPVAHYELSGTSIADALKSRRDALPEFADRYYRLISRQVEIKATDASEVAEIIHHVDGETEVRIYQRNESEDNGLGEPYFRRVFLPRETQEIRLYLRGGDDRAVISGVNGRITIRVIGGAGDDELINTSEAGGGRTRFYDSQGNNEFVTGRGGGGARIDRRQYERPPARDQAHKFALDWGGITIALPFITFSPDLGLYFGTLGYRENYGFRNPPYSSRHGFNVGFATDPLKPIVSLSSRFRGVGGGGHGINVRTFLQYSGLEILRFHGFGNETIASPSSFFKVAQEQVTVRPSLEFEFSDRASFDVGPVYKFSNTDLDENSQRFIGTLDPPLYGTGSFSQLGAELELDIDGRDVPGNARRGGRLIIAGSLFPDIADVESTFGEVHGEASVFLSANVATEPTLALRVGGKKVWGTYPFHEAAYLGGDSDLRGFRDQRFAGDAAVFGNVEARFAVGRIRFLVPMRLGIFGVGDVGRVFFDGDLPDADTWHTGIGGGLWFSFINRNHTLSVAIVDGEDLTGVYVRGGFLF